jgi:Zn-dependent protease with chaperone function
MQSSQDSGHGQKPRLNPFAFPPETDFRFWLLILAVLGASLFTYELLYFNVPANQERYFEVARSCWQDFSSLADQTSLTALAGMDGAGNCMAAANLDIAVWGILGLGIEIALAFGLYWFYPDWKIRKDKLEPLLPEDASDVLAALEDLSQEAGLDKAPVFLWNPLNPAPGGVAFGRLRRYYVALSGGLVTLYYTDSPAFKAVALHELAHIRNKDIDKTYFTVSIWRAYVLAALLPLVLGLLANPLGDVFGIAWRAAVLALLVYLTRNAVLRTREVYADVRASSWEGRREALERMVAGLGYAGKHRIQVLFQVHPDPTYRRMAVHDTSLLFRLSFWDSLATGIAASISFLSLEALVYAFFPTATLLPSLIAAVLLASMAAGVVGLQVWRMVFASQALGQRFANLFPASLGLAMGIWLGRNISFLRYIENSSADLSLLDHGVRLVFTLAWLGVMLAGLLIWAHWVAGGACEWLKVAASGRNPRKITAAGLVVAGYLLVVWLGSLLWISKFDSSSDSILMISLITAAALPSVVALSPITLLISLSLWAFPLSARFWRRQSLPISQASWAYLGHSPGEQHEAEPVKLNPWQALGAGLFMGILFSIVLLLVRFGLRVGLDEAVRSGDEFKLLLYYGSIAAAVLLQALAAIAVVGWVNTLGLAHGMLAAWTAGSVCALGMLATNLLFGGTVDPSFAWQTYSMTVNLGTLLAIPAASLAWLAGNWLHSERDAMRPVVTPEKGF